MNKIMLIAQIVTGGFLIGSVTLQTKGTGFTRTWKAQSSFTRRGVEKVFFKLTIIVAVIFILVSVLQIML